MNDTTNIKNFYNADKYFLVDTINGTLKASNINLKAIPNSPINLKGRMTYKVLSKKRIEEKDSDKEIYTSVETLGFLRTSFDPYQEDLDVINYEVLKLLGINAMHDIVFAENIKTATEKFSDCFKKMRRVNVNYLIIVCRRSRRSGYSCQGHYRHSGRPFRPCCHRRSRQCLKLPLFLIPESSLQQSLNPGRVCSLCRLQGCQSISSRCQMFRQQ